MMEGEEPLAVAQPRWRQAVAQLGGQTSDHLVLGEGSSSIIPASVAVILFK